MERSIEGELSLIVLEQQAKWPACANQYQTDHPNSLVEAQPNEETAADFVERVGRRIASLASKGMQPRVAIIATNSRLDPATLKARHRMAQLAVQAMGLSGELVLSASLGDYSPADEHGELVRHELFALAGTLCDELAGTDIGVSVRFPQANEQSGLRPSVHKIEADPTSVASG
jgi:hypothetical protein